MRLDELDQPLSFEDKLPFGKYSGWSVQNVLKHDASYLQWWDDNIPFPKLSDEVMEEVDRRMDESFFFKELHFEEDCLF